MSWAALSRQPPADQTHGWAVSRGRPPTRGDHRCPTAPVTTGRPRSAAQRSSSRSGTHRRQFRVLTGDRPTGPLHVGHYLGTLANRVRLQNLGVEVIVLIADYQVLTDRQASQQLPATVRGVVADYLAAGIDPDRSTIFTHSAVPALNELVLPFLSLVSDAELHRNPTVKAETEATGRPPTGLMLTYPVHQAADILFCQRQPGAGGPRPAAAPGDHAARRPAVQRALRRPGAAVPGARRPAHCHPDAGRARRAEDEQVRAATRSRCRRPRTTPRR